MFPRKKIVDVQGKVKAKVVKPPEIYNIPPSLGPLLNFRFLMKKKERGWEKYYLLVEEPYQRNGRKMTVGILKAARGQRKENDIYSPVVWEPLDISQTVTVPTITEAEVQSGRSVFLVNPALLSLDPTNPHFSHWKADRIGTDKNINEIFAIWSCNGYRKIPSSSPWLKAFEASRDYSFADGYWYNIFEKDEYDCDI